MTDPSPRGPLDHLAPHELYFVMKHVADDRDEGGELRSASDALTRWLLEPHGERALEFRPSGEERALFPALAHVLSVRVQNSRADGVRVTYTPRCYVVVLYGVATPGEPDDYPLRATLVAARSRASALAWAETSIQQGGTIWWGPRRMLHRVAVSSEVVPEGRRAYDQGTAGDPASFRFLRLYEGISQPFSTQGDALACCAALGATRNGPWIELPD